MTEALGATKSERITGRVGYPSGYYNRFLTGASHIFLLGSYDAAIPLIDDFGPTVVFESAFDGEQGVGIGFQPAASRLTKKYGMHPF